MVEMTDEHETDLLAALPRTRPHRRSDKRTAPKPAAAAPAETPEPAAAAPAARKPTPAPRAKPAPKAAAARKRPRPKGNPHAKPLRQPAQPRGIPKARRAPKRKPAPAAAPELVGTAVQAVGELAEIGLTLTARAIRNAAARLPKP